MVMGISRQEVAPVFEDVVPYYDAMNDYLSLGAHRYWKRWFCQQFAIINHGHFLDVATGTGDILMGAISRQVAAHYYALDPSEPMLEQAKWRLAAAGFLSKKVSHGAKITFVPSMAEDLSFFKNQSLDGISCAFGLRNMSDRPKALSEFFRVLKSSSLCHILEFAPPDNSLPMRLYQKYLKYALPLIGKMTFGDQKNYEYLANSIQSFWTIEECSEALRHAGFERVKAIKIFGGIACYYQGERP